MPRPKGSLNKRTIEKQQAAAAAAGIGHNSGQTLQALSDEQVKALHHNSHVPLFERTLAAKKDADAAFKNACKLIKSEGGTVAEVKRTIEIRKNPAQAEKDIQAEIEKLMRVARWNALSIGSQATMFGPDVRPLTERAKEEGIIAGMRGDKMTSAYDQHDAEQAWLEGWHEGQATLASKIKPLSDSTLLRGPQNQGDKPDDFDGEADGAAGGDDDAWPDEKQASANKARDPDQPAL